MLHKNQGVITLLKLRLRLGSTSDPSGGNYSAPPDPSLYLRDPLRSREERAEWTGQEVRGGGERRRMERQGRDGVEREEVYFAPS